ncbi:ESPR domain-containing protein, partial [Mitsuokella jalaludinii]
MNRIFKVIWSKTKHCYIVVSEYAKANTKAVHTGLRTTAAAAAVAAMLLAPVNYNYAWAADTVTVEEADTSTTTQQTQTVYTTDGADKTFATKADAAVQDAGVVKADKKIGENVTALGKGLYDETAARIGADAAQDKVIQKVNENLVQSVNTINKNVADGFTALNTADANEAKARTDADAAEKAAREVGDTTLDTRITKVKEYLENQTSENYVSKTDAAVQDGAIVKADKTIGENVTNLDAALAKETAARIGADKAQDKVIETVNQNMVDGFNTINTNMANGFAALNQADANEAKARADADAAEQAARIGADAKLAEAVNSSISLSADNVLHKNTTNVDANGIVTTGKADVTEVILNKGGDNQITLSDKGVKVGTNSSVMDKDGVYTGGDTYSDAKAALKSNGSIKGADGDFTVDGTTGNVSTKGSLTAASGKIGNVSMSADGIMTGVKDLTASGRISAGSFTDGTATMSNGSLNGINQINATGNIVTTGNMKAHDITAEGTIKGETINAATGTFSGAVSAGSLNVTNKLTAGNIEST